MPPRATSNTAKSTRGFCSTIRADFGPDASARITRRSSMTTPSVEVMPTLRPMPLKMWAIIREVVVLPLVPVTATIGIRLAAPGGKSMSTTGLAMNCGSPTVGWVCIRKPGAALTSQIAPPVSRTGWVMSGQMKSMPAMSRPTIRAASSAISTFSGCASKVRSIEMPPVDMLPVSVSLTISPFGRHVAELVALVGEQLDGGVVDLDPGQHLLVADAAARVGVGLLDQVLDGLVPPSPITWAGTRSAIGGHPAVDDQAPVVASGDERLDDHPSPPGLVLGDREGLADVVVALQVEADAPAVVAVERLDHDRVADPLGDGRTAWSAVRTDSCLGTGRPAAPSSRVVRSLSEAMSTAIALVAEVIVARIRFWCTPWPSWTSECSLSRIHGMSRETASSRMAWVDGPNAVRSARRMNASSSRPKSNSGSASTRWLTRRTASRPAARPTCSST